MPNSNLQVVSRLLGATVEELDISPLQYELAVRRYSDLGQWLVALGGIPKTLSPLRRHRGVPFEGSVGPVFIVVVHEVLVGVAALGVVVPVAGVGPFSLRVRWKRSTLPLVWGR